MFVFILYVRLFATSIWLSFPHQYYFYPQSFKPLNGRVELTGIQALLIYLLIHPLIHSFTHPLIHSFTIQSSIHLSFVHSLFHSFLHPLIPSSTHSFIHSSIHSLIYPSTHSFIHQLIHLSTHYSFNNYCLNTYYAFSADLSTRDTVVSKKSLLQGTSFLEVPTSFSSRSKL